jgi:hypothetical protein
MESYQQEWIAERRAYLRRKHYIQSRPSFIEAVFKYDFYAETDSQSFYCLCNPNFSLKALEIFVEKNKRYCKIDGVLSAVISRNPNITLDFVKRYRFIEFEWSILSKSIIVSMAEVMDNLHLPWNFDMLCQNPWISYADIENYRVLQNWHYISQRSNLSINFILAHRDKYWDYDEIINDKISDSQESRELLKLLDADCHLNADSLLLLTNWRKHAEASEADILNEPTYAWWNYIDIIRDPRYSLEFCKQICDTKAYGKYGLLLCNKAITEEFIVKHDLLKDVSYFSSDAMADINPEFILKNVNFALGRMHTDGFDSYLSGHFRVDAQFVIKHPEVNWDWCILAENNINITADDIIAHANLPWIQYLINNKFLRAEHAAEIHEDICKFENHERYLWDNRNVYNIAITRDIKTRQKHLIEIVADVMPKTIGMCIMRYIDY